MLSLGSLQTAGVKECLQSQISVFGVYRTSPVLPRGTATLQACPSGQLPLVFTASDRNIQVRLMWNNACLGICVFTFVYMSLCVLLCSWVCLFACYRIQYVCLFVDMFLSLITVYVWCMHKSTQFVLQCAVLCSQVSIHMHINVLYTERYIRMYSADYLVSTWVSTYSCLVSTPHSVPSSRTLCQLVLMRSTGLMCPLRYSLSKLDCTYVCAVYPLTHTVPMYYIEQYTHPHIKQYTHSHVLYQCIT